MIEDTELREIFESESEEHFHLFDTLLVQLENDPENKKVLNEVLRKLHSLKGSARMLGVNDVELLTHQIEEFFHALHKGEVAFSSSLNDLMFLSFDSLKRMIREAITGIPANVDFLSLMEQLKPDDKDQKKAQNPQKISEGRAKKKRGFEEKKMSLEEGLPKNMESLIDPTLTVLQVKDNETLRIKSKKLDQLLTQVGELLVTKNRFFSRLQEAKQIMEFWGDWSRRTVSKSGKFISDRENEETSFLNLGTKNISTVFKDFVTNFSEDYAHLEMLSNRMEGEIRRARLLSFSNIFKLFPRMIRDLSKSRGKTIELLLFGEEVEADKRILEEIKDVLVHLLRNAVDHGIETPQERVRLGKPEMGTIMLQVEGHPRGISIEVGDDGGGLNPEKIRQTAIKRKYRNEKEIQAMSDEEVQTLIFGSGFSTAPLVTDVSGRGIGLDIVSNKINRLAGTIQIDSEQGKGTMFQIILPVTLSTSRVFIVKTAGFCYAIPEENIQTVRLIHRSDIFRMEGREVIMFEKQRIFVANLKDILELPIEEMPDKQKLKEKSLVCIILSSVENRIALIVDKLEDEQEIVLKQQSTLLKQIRNVTGVTTLANGEICMVLNPKDLIRSLMKQNYVSSTNHFFDQKESIRQRVLIAEDSVTTRTQEKRILESAGYEVVLAVDGLEAIQKLKEQSFDALISDIQMPNMDGFLLTENVRKDPQLKELPVILVTSLASNEDKQKGVEVGADAYITKGNFDQRVLLETLERLI